MATSPDGDIIANDADLLRRKKRRKRNPEEWAAYQKAWREHNPGKASATAKAWRERNPEKIAAYEKARPSRSRKITAEHAARKREYEARNPEKARAWKIAEAIPRPDTCERCGDQGLIHRHHPDYTKPLMVEILCPRCHKAVHREMRLPAEAEMAQPG